MVHEIYYGNTQSKIIFIWKSTQDCNVKSDEDVINEELLVWKNLEN